MELVVGQYVRLKKEHPCGSSWWQIVRIGADIRLKCSGCGHLVMLPRSKVVKNIKEIQDRIDFPS